MSINATAEKPYHVQPELSEKAKAALLRAQGRRLQEGQKVRIKDIAAEVIERWAETAP
ncbi:hypothetical protein LJ737_19715 [Hymenobacter sp. 15J16-1T3B]|uniref:hypothetical protein n=1 Tax=Hymenobacter sp. 15J16-1T3B TaxID=2886941 RepID=UPI001D12CDE0|nr:hypothetical protein [Hymenobacter sp. 15J16-1T3B]MCC3159479.1 hypothetical protein [Hymenobacter sp. 15J16-1T3B]